jgi:deoxycytidine triphosphate deaminase
MPIGQITYFEVGEPNVPYNKKKNAKYNNHDPRPQPSQMWRNFQDRKIE